MIKKFKPRVLRVLGLWLALTYTAFLVNDLAHKPMLPRFADAAAILFGAWLFDRYDKAVINVNTFDIR